MAQFESHYGDIFHSKAIALVNPVNCFGVSGKGLALEFRQRFPLNYTEYVKACHEKRLKIGTILPVAFDVEPVRYIVNFPTKAHWKDPSRRLYILHGLQALKDWMLEENIPSVAIPQIGCGLGKLDWAVIRQDVCTQLEDVDALIELYDGF